MFENDADTYLVAIHCEGPSEAARHDRFVLIVYGRLLSDDFPEGRSWVPVRQWTDDSGRLVRAKDHDVHAKKAAAKGSYMSDAGIPRQHYQYRFRCARCGLDEQRRHGPELDPVFDLLADNGVREISVRAFVARVWG